MMQLYNQYVDIYLLIILGILIISEIPAKFPSEPHLAVFATLLVLMHVTTSIFYNCSVNAIAQYYSNRCLETYILMINLVFA